jgi:hypothetical protein
MSPHLASRFPIANEKSNCRANFDGDYSVCFVVFIDVAYFRGIKGGGFQPGDMVEMNQGCLRHAVNIRSWVDAALLPPNAAIR